MALNDGKETKTLKQLQKETPSETEISHRLAMAQLATDYEAAMISASLLEYTMKQALISRFVPLGVDKLEGLFSSNENGPLSSFSSKIKMIHAIGIVDNEMRLHFEVIRIVRNHFAHHHNNVTFNDVEISRECAKLKEMKILPKEAVEARKPNLTPKLRYVQTCFISASSLSSFVKGFRFPVAIGDVSSGPLSIF